MAVDKEAARLRDQLEIEQLKCQLAEAVRATRKAQDGDAPSEMGKDLDACMVALRECREMGARVVRINNFVVEFGTEPLPAGLSAKVEAT